MKQRTFTLLYLTILLSILTIPWSQAQQRTRAKSAEGIKKFQKYADQNKGRFDSIIKSTKQQSRLPRTNAPLDLQSWKKMKADSAPKSAIKSYMTTVRKAKSVTPQRPSTARLAATADAPAIIYVRQGDQVLQDGTSWENAYYELADALLFAKENPGVEEIWVANGIYHPLYNHNYVNEGDDFQYQDQVFIMLPGIKMYGGFEGIEESIADRKLRISSTGLPGDEEFTTILSGNLTLDEEEPETEMHTNRVVLAVGDLGDAALDGFVIAGAQAFGEDAIELNGEVISQQIGAGITIINSSPALTNLIVAHNSGASDGGGIYATGSTFVMTNSLIYENNSSTRGGGMYITNSQPVLTNVTISDNFAELEGGGAYFNGNTNAKVRNTILSRNISTASENSYRDPAATVTFSASVVRDSGGSSNWDPAIGTDDGGNLDTNPYFFSGEGVYGLRPYSEAVNAGRDLYFEPGQVPDLSYLETDQRGMQRKIGSSIDIGALESQFENLSTPLFPSDDGIMYVKKGGTGNGSSWTEAAGDLADAIFAANVNRFVDQIWVAGGTYTPRYTPHTLSDDNPQSIYNTFLIPRSVSVYGGFAGGETEIGQRVTGDPANKTILSGDLAGDDNFNFNKLYEEGPYEALGNNTLHVVTIVGSPGSEVLLDGVTIEGAFNLSDPNEALLGETLLINENIVPVYLGAGVYVQSALAGFVNSMIRNSLGNLGGGITNVNGLTFISNSLIYNNTDFFSGSGITTIGPGSSLALFSSTVSQNLGVGNGAAFGSLFSDIYVVSSIVYDNLSFSYEFDEEGNYIKNDFSSDGSTGAISNSVVGGSGGSGNWQVNDDEFPPAIIQDLGGNLDEDPAFKDVFQGDFTLTNCSPAIDAGEVLEDLPISEYPLTDLAGNARIFNDIPDIGAYELQSLQSSDGTSLAGNKKQSAFTFTDFSSHTFTAETGVCDLDVLTFAPSNFGGQVVARVYLDREVYSFNDAFYLQRHYDITPTETDPEAAQGQVTLYFRQAEFDALNLKLTAGDRLPTGVATGEAARIANIRIYQFHGDSYDLSGEPWSYESKRTVIDPDDDDIVFNADQNRWEVTFNVEGFSGFFGGSVGQNPLPVRLVSFDGKRLDDQKVKLEWKVAEQVGIDVYDVEYSETGKKFGKIGQVAASSLTTTEYSFTDSLFRTGDRAYYRLKIKELDGKMAYSQIVTIKSLAKNGMIAYPVPAKNELWIDWKKTEATSVDLLDYHGRVLKTIKRTSPSQKVDISALPAGIFLLKAEGNSVLKVVKE
ncbi:choice-of-anchor Q domain-containing protein [Dyadobacter sp. CY343]|uniref:choice-of-anchor Q domain-containing protein n=1 Tax=Dyadobacter sp. CY343 TaxID=2907299 RepID=UPI001F24F526|nr:choice-of-anchor Q domain-containing protein [Dyadobacter sp. CY343]MCE7059771.1 hypothetical protein [Dyadobacter sp. CY343]